jgi:L-ascorbate metabolism protein UlaG (beta-lactamase superfamily)
VGTATPVVAPSGAGRLLRSKGVRRAVELLPGQSTTVAGVRVEATAAEHTASRLPGGEAIPALGYLVGEDPRTYFAGDTDLFAGMAELAPLDVALLPVAGWGKKLGPGHLDPQRAAAALALLRPSVAVPIHWGTYRVARRPDESAGPAEAFARAAAELAPEVEVRILRVEDTLALD